MSRPSTPPEGFHLSQHASVRDIQNAVCEAFGIDATDMASRTRDWRISRPRQVAMYLARELTPWSYPNLGRFFHRDHSTVIHAIQQVDKRIAESKELAWKVNALKLQLVSNDPQNNSSKVNLDAFVEVLASA